MITVNKSTSWWRRLPAPKEPDVHAAMEQLPPNMRFVLWEWANGRPMAEIAAELGKTRQWIYKLVEYALHDLRRHLETDPRVGAEG